MTHCLVLGMTESGKTTLGKRLVRIIRPQGIPVIVCDTLCDPEWGADFQTSDPDEFLRVFWGSRRCVAIVDEAGDAVGRYNDLMQQTATKGRHWGHSVFYLSQRGVQLAPTVRHQCGRLFLFTSARSDGKIHADEWNAPILASCHTLRKGEYFEATRFGQIRKGSLFGVPVNDITTDSRNGGRELQREDPRPTPKQPAQEPGNSEHIIGVSGSRRESDRHYLNGGTRTKPSGNPDDAGVPDST